MDSNDVVPDASPSEPMYITHLFQPLHYPAFDSISGSRLTVSDAAQWPPQVLFDVVYASAVLHEFSAPHVRTRIAEIWDELYYPRGGFDATAAKKRMEGRRERVRRDVVRHRVSGSQLQLQVGRGGPDYLDFAVLVPYLAMSPAELVRYLDDVDAEAEQDAHRRVAERVKRWREDVVSSAV